MHDNSSKTYNLRIPSELIDAIDELLQTQRERDRARRWFGPAYNRSDMFRMLLARGLEVVRAEVERDTRRPFREDTLDRAPVDPFARLAEPLGRTERRRNRRRTRHAR